MPRKLLIRSNVHPYHVTSRCNNRETFHYDLDKVWEIFSFEIKELIESHQSKIHAFVLMPNHFHLLISTPGEDLGKAMQTFIASVTRKINLKSGRTGRVFGARYHWSLIGSPNYYDNVLKYVYRNPVKGGLITTVQNYRYSSLGAILENTASWIQPPLGYEMNIPNNRKTEFLNWLNQPFGTEQEIAIKKGFLKPEFHPPKNRSDRKIPDFTGFNSKDALHIQKVSDT